MYGYNIDGSLSGEIFYVGIIDIFTEYNFKKKVSFNHYICGFDV